MLVTGLRIGDAVQLQRSSISTGKQRIRTEKTGVDVCVPLPAELLHELDTASKRLDDNSCTVIREGVHIFGSALSRLNALDGQHFRRPVAAAKAGYEAHAA